jgi:L-amino acid N-acyltransferase YncA
MPAVSDRRPPTGAHLSATTPAALDSKIDGRMAFAARRATPADVAAIREIYNQGIEDRVGTFETRPRSDEDIHAWFDGRHPIVIVEGDDGTIGAFASTSSYRTRECYRGIAEFSVYVRRSARGHGLGRIAMEALIAEARAAGFWKLVSRVFVENAASRTLLGKVGFREVGVYEKHARLDGAWRDVVIVERLIPENQSTTEAPGAAATALRG